MQTLRAIQTRYRGRRFRSRLEARWAVFFDALDVAWQYEPEGFTLPDGTRYLPDFWLPRQQTWVEIKATMPSGAELAKVQQFMRAVDTIAYGAWMDGESDFVMPPPDRGVDAWLVVGEPFIDERTNQYEVFSMPCPTHNLLRCMTESCTPSWIHEPKPVFTTCPLCQRLQLVDGRFHVARHMYCNWCDVLARNTQPSAEGYFHKGDIYRHGDVDCLLPPKMVRAYAAAMSARFEHGEKPK